MRGRLSALVRSETVTQCARHLFGCCAAAIAATACCWWVKAHCLVQSYAVALIATSVVQLVSGIRWHTPAKGNQFFLLFPCIRTRTHTHTMPRRCLNLYACTRSHTHQCVHMYWWRRGIWQHRSAREKSTFPFIWRQATAKWRKGATTAMLVSGSARHHQRYYSLISLHSFSYTFYFFYTLIHLCLLIGVRGVLWRAASFALQFFRFRLVFLF